MRTVLGIFRAACYSPGMTDRDEAILLAVAHRLTKAGYAVSLVHEEDFVPSLPMPDIVIHMARSPQVLDILQRWQKVGCRIINSVEGVRSVERAALAGWCAAQSIPTPKTWIVDTSAPQAYGVTYPCWVKRAGACAQEPDDVCRVDNAEKYTQCLSHFYARGIHNVVVMEHLEGSCIKFYAVQGTGFFYSLPAEQLGYDKFSNPSLGKEESSTKQAGSYIDNPFLDFNFPLEVYGGDAIIGTDGVARLIDLNDWPSFSACHEKAADAIAQLVRSEL